MNFFSQLRIGRRLSVAFAVMVAFGVWWRAQRRG